MFIGCLKFTGHIHDKIKHNFNTCDDKEILDTYERFREL